MVNAASFMHMHVVRKTRHHQNRSAAPMQGLHFPRRVYWTHRGVSWRQRLYSEGELMKVSVGLVMLEPACTRLEVAAE